MFQNKTTYHKFHGDLIMSNDKKVVEAKNVLDRFANLEKPKLTVKVGGAKSSIELSKIEDLIRSTNGATLGDAHVIMYGSEDQGKIADPDGKDGRKLLRLAWDNIDPATELSVFIKKPVYTRFIVSKKEYPGFFEHWIGGYKPGIDSRAKTRNSYTLDELGLE